MICWGLLMATDVVTGQNTSACQTALDQTALIQIHLLYFLLDTTSPFFPLGQRPEDQGSIQNRPICSVISLSRLGKRTVIKQPLASCRAWIPDTHTRKLAVVLDPHCLRLVFMNDWLWSLKKKNTRKKNDLLQKQSRKEKGKRGGKKVNLRTWPYSVDLVKITSTSFCVSNKREIML